MRQLINWLYTASFLSLFNFRLREHMAHLDPLLRVNHLLHCFLWIELLISDFPLIASPLKAAINEWMLLSLLVRGLSLCLTKQSAFIIILACQRREPKLPFHVALLLNTCPLKIIIIEGA